MASNERPIIIKKIKKISGGHHGGAWKVAYADFVTAMMAFFLLMWLINTTTPEQKRGIADYFAPASVALSSSGSGGILGGTEIAQEGSRSRGASSIVERLSPDAPQTEAVQEQKQPERVKTDDEISDEALKKALELREKAEFERAEQSLRQALEDLPELAELSKHLLIDQTPEGLRIQLVDQEGRSMFAPGAKEPLERTQKLIGLVAKVIDQLPNRISISGHTDESPKNSGAGFSEWELSADRANSARRILERSGIDPGRIFQVSGKAQSEPLFPDDPTAPGNRRISIVLLHAAPVLPKNTGF